MQAIAIALAMTAGAGDEVVIPTPAWPNAAAAAGILGARAVEVPMSFGNDGWSLDLERIAAAITPRTRALFVVSPSNPTGWTATAAELGALLALARRHGLWIIADETYARFWYGEGERAPSFLDVMDAGRPHPVRQHVLQELGDDRLAHRLDQWPTPALGQVIENMIQYSTSGVAAFMQRAALVAVERGEGFVAHQIARARHGRDLMCDALSATGRCRFAVPAGAFYLFFTVDGEDDPRRLVMRLIDEGNIGLAPGTAFGAGGEKFLRLCFARKAEDLELAAERLSRACLRRALNRHSISRDTLSCILTSIQPSIQFGSTAL